VTVGEIISQYIVKHEEIYLKKVPRAQTMSDGIVWARFHRHLGPGPGANGIL